MDSINPRRILLIRLRAIGDVVLITPLLRALKHRYPTAKLHVLTDVIPGTLLEGNPHVDRLIVSPPRNASLWTQLTFLGGLRRAGYDLCLDLFGNPRSAWMTFATGARARVGYAYRARRFVYTHPVPKNLVRKYQVEVNLDVLRHLGVPDAGFQTELFLTPAERSWGHNHLIKLKTKNSKLKIGLNPTGTWSAKRWPVSHWTELVERLALQGVKPLVFSAPGDAEGVQAWAASLGDKVVLAPPTDLRQLASLISGLDLLVGNDGAPHHIAQALGVKTLTLFGPTWGLSWNSPGDARFRFLQTFPPCGPCDKTKCPLPVKGTPFYKQCLEDLTPEWVAGEIEKMVGDGKNLGVFPKNQ